MTYDCRVITRSSCQGTTVPDFFFDVADDRTLGALSNGENVADGESRFFATVHKGAGVHAFGGDESLRAEFVAIWVTENDASEGGTTYSNDNG